MATIINTPGSTTDSSGTNGLLTVVVLIVFFLLLIYFGLPMLRRATSVPQVNVPDNIDVNVNTPQQGQ